MLVNIDLNGIKLFETIQTLLRTNRTTTTRVGVNAGARVHAGVRAGVRAGARAGVRAGVSARYNVTYSNPGRLGNKIFAYASLIAIARNNNLNPVLSPGSSLRNVFQVTSDILDRRRSRSAWRVFYEKQACAFDRRTLHLKLDTNIEFVGYLQSWKYFRNFTDEVRRELRFVNSVQHDADAYVKSVVERNFGRNSSGVVTVGIHVRRSDMASSAANSRGYTVGSADYIKSAMFYFQTKYKKLVFIVCTDDVTWCERNVAPLDKRVVISRDAKDAVDLATLALCQHSIITTGTFGWWGAWLAGGTTIYYKRFPRPGSPIASAFNRGDYFPPRWIAL